MIHAAACQPTAGWRPVPLELTIGGGETRTIMSGRSESILGHAMSILPAGQSALLDLMSSVEIELRDPDHWLENRDDDALVNGANLAILGNELIQFGTAEAIGPGRFRLSRLLRGRRGTEWAMGEHAVGEPFALIDANAVVPIELPLEAIGSEISVKPAGLADAAAVPVKQAVSGETLRPPSPVHLDMEWAVDGALNVRWVRRSRVGWAWLDAIEAPLGETAELYRLLFTGAAGSLTVETNVPTVSLSSDQVGSIGPGPATVSVTQVGDYAESRPASMTIIVT